MSLAGPAIALATSEQLHDLLLGSIATVLDEIRFAQDSIGA